MIAMTISLVYGGNDLPWGQHFTKNLTKIANNESLSPQEWRDYQNVVTSPTFAQFVLKYINSPISHLPSPSNFTVLTGENPENFGVDRISLENKNNTFENFDVSFHPKLDIFLTHIKSFSEETSDQSQVLFLYGPAGVGKTHLITAAVNKLKASGQKICFARGDELYELLNQKFGYGDTMRRFKQSNFDVVVIDDLNTVNAFHKAFLSALFLDAWDKGGKKILISANIQHSNFADLICSGQHGVNANEKERLRSRINAMFKDRILDFSGIPTRR